MPQCLLYCAQKPCRDVDGDHTEVKQEPGPYVATGNGLDTMRWLWKPRIAQCRNAILAFLIPYAFPHTYLDEDLTPSAAAILTSIPCMHIILLLLGFAVIYGSPSLKEPFAALSGTNPKKIWREKKPLAHDWRTCLVQLAGDLDYYSKWFDAPSWSNHGKICSVYKSTYHGDLSWRDNRFSSGWTNASLKQRTYREHFPPTCALFDLPSLSSLNGFGYIASNSGTRCKNLQGWSLISRPFFSLQRAIQSSRGGLLILRGCTQLRSNFGPHMDSTDAHPKESGRSGRSRSKHIQDHLET